MNSEIIALIVVSVFLIVIMIKFNIQDAKKRKREQNVEKFAKQKGLTFKPFFDEPLKYKEVLNCFLGMSDPVFCNVIEKNIKDGVTLYVGELQWVKPTHIGKRNAN